MAQGFFCLSPRVWYGKGLHGRGEGRRGPDLYAPSSPDYAQRNHKTLSKLPNGMTLETIGHPPGTPRPPATAPYKEPALEPNPAPVVDPKAPKVRLGAPKSASPLPDLKPGLGRG